MNKEKNIKLHSILPDYIKGKRKGAEANYIEREAMLDPFLSEALEGIDSVEDNHAKNIENMHDKIMQRAYKHKKYHRRIMIWGAAASINTIFTWSAAACISLGIAGGLIYFSSVSENSRTGFTVSDSNETYYDNDFTAKIKDSKKDIIPEELLLPNVIEPPMPRNIEIPDIESNNIKIIEENTVISDILNFDKDSIIAEKHKVDYVNPQKLDPETYIDENIPFAIVEEYPKFMGKDANAFKEWIQENIKYPENDACAQGRVILSFVVDKDGYVKNINVIKKVDAELEREAVRVVSSSPRWTPAKQKNIPVDFEFIFPVYFSISQ
ncbi:MAG: energy transducer TonB [Prevotellaceae bacterium]|jgi:protein TonB|nr:energy transducer TonB [Prevotellaceae bacterium]